jgi:hypothetical protein
MWIPWFLVRSSALVFRAVLGRIASIVRTLVGAFLVVLDRSTVDWNAFLLLLE